MKSKTINPALLTILATMLSLSVVTPTAADEQTRSRDWWRFEGNEYWRLFFPGWDKNRPKPATIEVSGDDRVLTIQPHDNELTVGVYGGNRSETISLLRHAQRIDFDVELESGPTMQVVLTLRDAKGEKWRFVPKALDATTETISWRYPKDVEEIYQGDPKNKTIDDALHLFNMRYIRPAGDAESRIRLKGATVTEYVPATEAIEVSLETSAAYPVIYKADVDQATILVENTADSPRRARLLVEVAERDGTTAATEHDFDLAAGASRRVPLTIGLKSFGIKTLKTTVAIDDDTRTDTTDFAYLDAVGNDAGRDDPWAFWIGGAESETDYAIMAAIGVEGIRMGGNWVHRERKPGIFTWDRTDEEVEAFARHGFDMQYLVSYGHPAYAREPWATELKGKRWPLQTAPPELGPWINWLRELATRYDGRITHFEIWNEPDLSSFWKGSTDDYIELLRESHRVLKEVNPDNVVMTGGFATATYHGGHALNPDMQERVLNEAADYFDVHTHHQHGRFRGFMAAIDGPLERWRSSGPAADKPLILNETALSYQQAGGEWEQAEELVKKMSFAFARGAQAYAWFVFFSAGTGHVSEFAMVHSPRHQPRYALVAYNELARQLRDTEFVEQIEPESGRLILRFADTSEGEDLFVLWHENDNAARRPLMLRVPEDSTVRRIDLMGNASPVAVRGGVVSIGIESEPVYVRVTSESSLARAQVLPPLMVLADAAVTVDQGGKGTARVVVSNPTDQPTAVPMTWRIGGRAIKEESIQLGVGEQRTVTAALNVPESSPELRLVVSAGVDSLGLEQTLDTPVVVTRSLAPGPIGARDPDFVLSDTDRVVNYFMNDPANLSKNWGGLDDLSARVWLSPIDTGLRIVIHAKDDVHQQQRGPGKLWQMDSVQVGVASLDHDGFYEIGIARRDDGKVLRKVFSNPTGLRLDETDLDVSIERSGQETHYDLTIPWSAFGDTRPSGIRFNVVVNDSDEGIREGLIRLSPGIDQTKNASLFPLLSFPAGR